MPDAPGCLGEGEQGEEPNEQCCAGLTPVPANTPIDPFDPDTACASPNCPCFVCTRCGNGVCGTGENLCNCESDCPRLPDQCFDNNECGTSFCADTDWGGCTQFIPYCDDNHCAVWKESYSNSFCLGKACMPSECQAGETADYSCWDGSTVTVCVCNDSGDWDCMDDPSSLCPDEPQCASGQTIDYSCPDGQQVPWCLCEGGDCKPFCDLIGTRSEGWYDPCTGDAIVFSQCAACASQCRYVGTYSEGWYDSCSGALIDYASCFAEFSCIDDPEGLCDPGPTRCEERGGTCVNDPGDCGMGGYVSADPLGCPNGSDCCLPGVPNECELEAGFCIDSGESCPLGASAVNLSCYGGDTCCQPWYDYCADAGGHCFEASDNGGCPDGWGSTSGVAYVCMDGGICCFPENPLSCEDQDGVCIGWSPICPEGTHYDEFTFCESGLPVCCLPDEPRDCGDLGGFCMSWTSGCPSGYHAEDGGCGDAVCAGGCVCCVPGGEEPQCLEWGGYCTGYNNGCVYGYTSISNPAGCDDPYGLCCLPWEDRCYDDRDCGEISCYHAGSGTQARCIETIPYCQDDGECASRSRSVAGAVCMDNQCRIVGECRPGEERWYTCNDGRDVPWCWCVEEGLWWCETDYPEDLCNEWECQPGEEEWFECPNGEWVPWCWCTDDGWWYCESDDPMQMCNEWECQPGEEEWFECPNGEWVPWCWCENGRWWCEPEPEMLCAGMYTCENLHGYCVPEILGCVDGYASSWNYECEGPCLGDCVCCLPQQTTACEDMGGYCNMSFDDCWEGYWPIDDPLGCPNIFGLQSECCMPYWF